MNQSATKSHTPTPYSWGIDDNGFPGLCIYFNDGRVCQLCKTADIDDEAKATAAFIVAACNAHATQAAQIEGLRGLILPALREASRALTELDGLAAHHNAAMIDDALQAFAPGSALSNLPAAPSDGDALRQALQSIHDDAAHALGTDSEPQERLSVARQDLQSIQATASAALNA